MVFSYRRARISGSRRTHSPTRASVTSTTSRQSDDKPRRPAFLRLGVISSDHCSLRASHTFVPNRHPRAQRAVRGRARLAHGPRTALTTVCGNAAASLRGRARRGVWVGTLSAALGGRVHGSELAGAAAVPHLARDQAIRRRKASPRRSRRTSGAAGARGDLRAAREDPLLGVTNPKAPHLVGAVLPQFVDRAAGTFQVQMLLLEPRLSIASARFRQLVGHGRELRAGIGSPARTGGSRWSGRRRPRHDRRRLTVALTGRQS